MTNLSKDKIIGGKFGFPIQFSNNIFSPPFLTGEPLFLFNARSGIKLVVDELSPDTVWLPSYLCNSIILSIDPALTKIAFYSIDSCLKIESDYFVKLIQPNDLFICIDYFGFPFDQVFLEKVKSRGCKILHDCSQALFFDWHDDICDYHLYSPRKFLGVPDGGVLHCREKINFSHITFKEPDNETIYLLLQALIMRREFDIFGGDRKWNELFHTGESSFSAGRCAMSQITQLFLNRAFDYLQIQMQRKENYLTLSQKLYDIALFPELSENVIPLGFPIKVNKRDQLQKELFAKNIFPPIHWNIEEVVPNHFSESHLLSQDIMTLPCDQRYDKEDMEFLAESVLELIV